jgi:hypothetical protein
MDASNPPADAGKPDLGLGEGCAPEGTRDVRLLALALSERWPMSEAARAAAVARLERVVLNPETKPRAFYHALKALTSLSRVNLESIATAIRAKLAEGPTTEDTLIELALRLRDRQNGGRP